nr:MAG TPA: hypothetical protein [Caudoviricetes sp.]
MQQSKLTKGGDVMALAFFMIFVFIYNVICAVKDN